MRGAFLRRHWPLVGAVLILWLTVAALLFISMRSNQGHVVYALDDSYISMAMAKNLSQHGVWGVTRHEFTSSSSSLLWPLVLAATYLIFGPNEVAPLAWNLVFGTILLWVIYRDLRGRRPASRWQLGSLVALAMVTPLPALAFIGLEHTLHALLSLAVAYLAADELSRDAGESLKSPLLPILTCLLVMTRYEALFQVFVILLAFLARRRWRDVSILAVLAVLPVAVYGVISVACGWHLLPNSVLLKGPALWAVRALTRSAPFSGAFLEGAAHLLGRAAYTVLLGAPHLLFLAAGVLMLAIRSLNRGRSLWDRDIIRMTLFTGTLLLHVQFARTGWLYRYEAYLVTLGSAIVAGTLLARTPGSWSEARGRVLRPSSAAVALLCLLPLVAFLQRAIGSLVRVAQATTNIYEQQYQMGLFLRDHYRGETVTAHDVGAINYLADIRCIGVDGLASLAALDMGQEGTLNSQAVSGFSRGKGIAVMYDGWLMEHGGIPREWISVGRWAIRNNVIAAEDTVSFYAVDHGKTGDLIDKLRLFGPRLPPGVKQAGKYTEVEKASGVEAPPPPSYSSLSVQ